MVTELAQELESLKITPGFLYTEWRDVADAHGATTWDDYRRQPRLGRKTRLNEKQRMAVWSMLEKLRNRLNERAAVTWPEVYRRLTQEYKSSEQRPYTHVVVDECQDITPAQLAFLAALAGTDGDSLFFAGDFAQQIFQTAFSWKSLGVEIRGRSRTLKINYRTTHQICGHADRLLDPEVADGDGKVEERRGTQSVLQGPPPAIHIFATPEEEAHVVGAWIKEIIQNGTAPHEVAIFVRSQDEFFRAQMAINASGLPSRVITDTEDLIPDTLNYGTMHLAKGLEFHAVAVMACDESIIPQKDRLNNAGDASDLDEIYRTEQYHLYVACTRARDALYVSAAKPASEFLRDLQE